MTARPGQFEPQQLGETVRRELDRLGGAPPGSAGIAEIVAMWPRAVGDVIARNAWPARLTKDGTLVVHAASSTWSFELGVLEGTIREKLGDLSPARLKFVVGSVPEPGVDSVEKVTHEAPRPTPSDRVRAASFADAIGDPTLRELVARAAAASLASGATGTGPTGPSDSIDVT